jgi:DNA-directed RNA polymerase subunit beta
MGSNMMRQAVPLLQPETPIVGTGIERSVAKDSRVLINAEGKGEVIYVDATKITIRYDRTEEEKLVSFDEDVKTYHLTKYIRTNQNTSVNLKPIVQRGDKVTKGQVYAKDMQPRMESLPLVAILWWHLCPGKVIILRMPS